MNKVTFVYQKSSYDAYDAQRIVFEACKYKSDVRIENGTKRGNAKSIIGLLSMNFLQGDEYAVTAEGPDSRAAAQGLAAFITSL